MKLLFMLVLFTKQDSQHIKQLRNDSI